MAEDSNFRTHSSEESDKFDTVACFSGNATNNLWVLDLTLDLLDFRNAELPLLVTLLILL
jgi:hypothetical protein